jgi:hypothetical protein
MLRSSIKFVSKSPKLAYNSDHSKSSYQNQAQLSSRVPKPKLRATQVNEFLKSVLRSELEKLNKLNNVNKEPLIKPAVIKSVSRKNSFSDMQIINVKKAPNNRNIEIIPQNSAKKNEGKLFIKIKKEDSKDRSSSCDKKDTAMSTKRSTSSSKKAPIDPINIDNPSFVKLYDDITDERSRLIHYIRQCTLIE